MSTIRIKIPKSKSASLAKKPIKRKLTESTKTSKKTTKRKLNEDIEGLDDLGSQFDGQPASPAKTAPTSPAANTAVKTPKKRGPKPKTNEVRPDNEAMNNRWRKLYAGMSDDEVD